MYVHKIGKSFQRDIAVPELDFPDGYFVGWTAECQIRLLDGTKLADVVCVWDDPVTTRNLTLTVVDTSTWTEGTAEIDVKLRRADGMTEITDTAQFVVQQAVTRPNV